MCAKAMAVTDRPDQPLLERGHQLPVDGSDPAVGVDIHHRAVQAVTAFRGALNDARVNGYVLAGGEGTQAVQVTGIEIHCLAAVVRKQ